MFRYAVVGWLLCNPLLIADPPRADKAHDKAPDDKIRELAGTAEFLRSVPKKYARVQAVDAPKRTITLLADGDKEAQTWPLTVEGEVRIHGWWGRLDQLSKDQRVWVWFKLDRQKKPVSLFLIADEWSEQDLHGTGLTLQQKTQDKLTWKKTKGDPFDTDAMKSEVFVKGAAAKLDDLKVGTQYFMETRNDGKRAILDAATFETKRSEQRKALADRWSKDGLPGTITVLHLSGEMDYLLDHETMRWARSLQAGDEVQLAAAPLIKGVVKSVKPWRERTLVRLVVKGLDQADLSVGQRINLRMKPSEKALADDALPPDIDRVRDKEERVDWFMASIYCTCGVGGDGCTGHYYTLSSCNPNACGMPDYMRKKIRESIDKGLSDREIFGELLKKYGKDLVRPHLLP